MQGRHSSTVQARRIRWLPVLGCLSAFALVLVGAAPSAVPKPAGKFEVLPLATSIGDSYLVYSTSSSGDDFVFGTMGARDPASGGPAAQACAPGAHAAIWMA